MYVPDSSVFSGVSPAVRPTKTTGLTGPRIKLATRIRRDHLWCFNSKKGEVSERRRWVKLRNESMQDSEAGFSGCYYYYYWCMVKRKENVHKYKPTTVLSSVLQLIATKCICSASVFLKHGRSLCTADVPSGTGMADTATVNKHCFVVSFIYFVSICPRTPATPILPVNLNHSEELLAARKAGLLRRVFKDVFMFSMCVRD